MASAFRFFKEYFLTGFLLLRGFVPDVSYAQSSGNIDGNVIENNHPIEFATVTVSKLSDSTRVLLFTSTDSLGRFFFNDLEDGSYQLKISLIGYNTHSQVVLLTPENHELSLRNLPLETAFNNLNEVVVTSHKNFIEKTDEGLIINASANFSQMTGTASDLLKNAPTVAVDAEGAITLRGKTPLILINGRNSNLANADQIPASSIESIEIIHNASAKYDANAESGIINIILKRSKQNGTTGAVALGAGLGSKGRINSSTLLNHKTNKWNLGFGYDNRFAGRTKHITNDRTNFNNANNYLINQDRNDQRVERLQNLKFNIDFVPDEKNSFSFEAIGNAEGQDNDEALRSLIHQSDNDFESGNDRRSLEYRRSKVGELAFNYNRRFPDPLTSLAASFSSSLEKGRENTDITTQNLSSSLTNIDELFLQKTHNYEDGIISNLSVDYKFPFTPNTILETGYKGIFRSIKTDFASFEKIDDYYVINTESSNLFDFNEQIHAVYALYHQTPHAKETTQWHYELGLRAEQVNNDGSSRNNSTVVRNDYFKIFPTASLIYHLKNDNYWKLYYGKRINLPRLGQLNPFTDITDVLNPHSGNPDLKPEIIDALELGYSIEKQHYSISSNLFYRHSINTIRNFFQQLPDGAVLNLPMNIGIANSYGLEGILFAKLNRLYDLTASITLFHQELDGSNLLFDAVQGSFNWYGKLLNDLVIGQNGKLQITANYNSASTTPQGRLTPLIYADLGYQQKLGKGNARLGLIVVDIFDTLKSGFQNTTSEFIFNRTQKADTRALMLTFAYLFKSAFKEELLKNQFSKEF